MNSRRTAVVAALVVSAAAALSILLPLGYMMRFFLDDSYFYMKIANHVAVGAGSTFDGINHTNGYHPLWLLVLAGSYRLLMLFTDTGPVTLLRYTFFVSLLINGASLYLLRELLRNVLPAGRGVSVFSLAALLLIPLVFFFVLGLESQFAVFLVILWLYQFFHPAPGPGAPYIRGAISGLLIICRLDLILFIVPVFMFLEHHHGRPARGQRNLLPAVLVSAIFPAVYVWYNYLQFGMFSSVSSRLEFQPGSFLLLLNLPSPLREPIEFLQVVAAALPAAVVFLQRKSLFNGESARIARALLLLYGSSFLFLLTHYTFNVAGAKEWYYAYPHLFGMVLLVLAVSGRRAERILRIAAALLLIAFFTLFRMNYYEASDAYRYALLVKETVPAGDVVLQVDYSGLIAFFSERNVVNGDGLVNSPVYYRALQQRKLPEYFAEHPYHWYSTYMYAPLARTDWFTDTLFSRGGAVFRFPYSALAATSQKIHGGIFRKKYGTFLLFKNQKP